MPRSHTLVSNLKTKGRRKIQQVWEWRARTQTYWWGKETLRRKKRKKNSLKSIPNLSRTSSRFVACIINLFSLTLCKGEEQMELKKYIQEIDKFLSWRNHDILFLSQNKIQQLIGKTKKKGDEKKKITKFKKDL
jgi:hypothetical protein